MKKSIIRISIYVLIATVLTVVLLSSCSSSKVGCYDTRGLVGYK
jgi:hypothetical protein